MLKIELQAPVQPKRSRMVQLGCVVPIEMADMLDAKSRDARCSRSDLVRRAIREVYMTPTPPQTPAAATNTGNQAVSLVRAVKCVQSLLAKGSRVASDFMKEARSQGFSNREIHAARRYLNVSTFYSDKDGVWYVTFGAKPEVKKVKKAVK